MALENVLLEVLLCVFVFLCLLRDVSVADGRSGTAEAHSVLVRAYSA
jgi:hypothetical protein